MKKIITLLVLLISHLSFAYPTPHPFPPFHIAGNLYYVGTDDLASYLIVTPQGNILINSNLAVTVPMLKSSIEKLGFKFNDTKILLVSHAHSDHVEGSDIIKRQTHAKYMVMDADVANVESGGKTDFNYGSDASMYFTPTHVDKILHDGDHVKLGGTVLTAYLTGGHTPGCTTWTFSVTDHGKRYHVVILGSAYVNPGYQLVHNKAYPKIALDYEHTFKTLKSLPCDIFLGAHALYFDLQKKYALLGKQAVNPFIDPEGYKKQIADREREFAEKLKQQQS